MSTEHTLSRVVFPEEGPPSTHVSVPGARWQLTSLSTVTCLVGGEEHTVAMLNIVPSTVCGVGSFSGTGTEN